MANKTYDPNATYEVVKGTPSIKDAKNNRTLLAVGDKTTLEHLQTHEIAYLVEELGMYKLASPAGGGSK